MKLTDKFEIIKGRPSRNRIVMPPMDTLMAENGMPNDFHVQHYGARAYGGVGTIVVESTAISSEGKIRAKDIGIWNDKQVEGHKKIVDISHKAGAIIGVQLNHAGAKAEMADEDRIGTTEFYNYLPMKRFKLITSEQIQEVEDKFVLAAKRAKTAGYDFIEIHAAHGYLLSEFINPITNEIIKSDDILERANVVINVVKKVHAAVDMPIGIRFSTSDHEPDGMNPIDFKPLVEKIDEYIAYYNISSGEVISHENVAEAMKNAGTSLYRLPLVKVFKKFTDKPLIMAGNVTNRENVEEAVSAGVSGVAIGREIILNPSLVINTLLKSDEITDEYHWNNNIWFNPKGYTALKEMLAKK